MKKWMILVCLIGLLMSVSANTGVALVHGKGSDKSSDPQAALDYWGTDMIRAATKNYKYPYVVAHYNGEAYMWEAANDVAAQLYTFIQDRQIDDLVICTHSFGGTVMRWIFSNPDYDWRYPTIIAKTRWVNTIAPPALGSEGADMAGELSGSWLTGWLVDLVGQNTNATKNCTTSLMAEYNRTLLFGTPGRPSLPKPFYWASGWGLWNDSIHPEDYGLATLSGIVGMPGEDDGMVSEYSAQAVGSQWFRTKANHHHNRRNDYDKIGDYIGEDVEQGITWSVASSMRQLTSADSRNSSNIASFNGNIIDSGNFTAKPHRVVSTRYVEFVPLQDEVMKEIPVLLEDSKETQVVVWSLGDSFSKPQVELAGENNERIAVESRQVELGEESSMPASCQHLVIPQSDSKKMLRLWRTQRQAKNSGYAVAVNTNSDLTLSCSLSQYAVFSGDSLTISARLAKAETPVSKATVYVEIGDKKGEKTRLDLQENEKGVYTLQKIVGEEIAERPGLWFLRIVATGRVPNSKQPFKRSAALYFRHAIQAGKISPASESLIRDEQGKITALGFSVPVAIDVPGKYRLLGILRHSVGGQSQGVAWAMQTREVEKGKVTYFLQFSPSDLKAVRGPLTLDLQLVSLNRLELAAKSSRTVTNGHSVEEWASVNMRGSGMDRRQIASLKQKIVADMRKNSKE